MKTANFLITKAKNIVRLGNELSQEALPECKRLEPDTAYVIGIEPIAALEKIIGNENLLKMVLKMRDSAGLKNVKGINRPAYEQKISKAHMMIFQKDGETYAMDLDSFNGTFVNNERLEGIRQIRAIDYISIGPLEMEITRMPDYSKKMALIIGSDTEKNLSGIRFDCHGIETLLRSREFKPENITKLIYDKNGISGDGKPTKLNIIDSLEKITEIQDEESLSVIYYSGHGAEDGSMVLPPWEGLDKDFRFLSDLDPVDLHEYVKAIPGYKLVMADSCYSGKIKDYFKKHPLPKTSVIASAKSNQEAYESGSIGKFTREFLKQATTQAAIRPGLIASQVYLETQENTMIITDPVIF